MRASRRIGGRERAAPRRAPPADLVEAQKRAASGGAAEALADLDRLLTRYPGDARVWHLKGAVLLAQGAVGAAGEALERARALAPDDPAILSNLAIACHREGKGQRALRHLEDAVRHAPDAAPIRFNLGRLALELGRAAEARRALQATLELEPGHLKARLELARLVLDQDGPAAARSILEPVHASAAAAPAMARVARAEGRPDEACRHLEAALRADPRNVPLRLDLGFCLQEAGRFDDALDLYRRLLTEEQSLYPLVERQLTGASAGRLWLDRKDLERALGLA
ncbi:MAG TPA: tetratricopeptide repeat protein [Geminicoccaceae bacterium]